MEKQEWGFKENHEVHATAALTMRSILEALMANMDEIGTGKSMIHPGHGDPSIYSSYRTSMIVEDALVEATRSAKFNCYAPGAGIDTARRLVCYTSNDGFLKTLLVGYVLGRVWYTGQDITEQNENYCSMFRRTFM